MRVSAGSLELSAGKRAVYTEPADAEEKVRIKIANATEFPPECVRLRVEFIDPGDD